MWPGSSRRRAAGRAVALVALLATVGGCSSDDSDAPQSASAADGESARSGSNPIAGRKLFVDSQGPAALQAARWRAQGRRSDAAAMSRLASRPTAVWIADDAAVAARVREVNGKAASAGQTALVVAYHVPGRDCGSFSAGGSGSSAAYRAWIRAFARGLGDHPAVVILEPDAIPQAVQDQCLSPAAKADRYRLLRYAVRTLRDRTDASVYLDAGNPGWIQPASRLLGPLRRSGIRAADGFALNVSNFYRTGTAVRYGRALSRRLGGAHFVIDTSRNGNGPSLRDDAGGPKWCNPPGRALGRDPTTDTGQAKVDAYLWVKEPGASDGSCRRGAPPAGHWWPEYALALVRNR